MNKNFFLLAGFAAIGFALYKLFGNKGPGVPTNGFGQPRDQGLPRQFGFAAPFFNDASYRPRLTRGTNAVLGAVQNGTAVAGGVVDLIGRVRNLFPARSAAPARVFDTFVDSQGGVATVPRGPGVPGFVGPVTDPLTSGGFDPDREFGGDVFAT